MPTFKAMCHFQTMKFLTQQIHSIKINNDFDTTRFLLLLYSVILNMLLLFIYIYIYIYIYVSTTVDLIWTYISIQLFYCYSAAVHIIRIIRINN